jgi:arylsulfatase A-like enzyme
MRKIYLTLLLGLICTGFSWAADTTIAARPNIIFIITDDHGYNDLEATDLRDEVDMPNIDRLSQGGALMTQAYATAPQCVPSRAGIVTGRYQQRFALERNGEGPLPLSQISIASRLKEQGYVTGHVGKWHLEPNRKTSKWLEDNHYKSIQDAPASAINAHGPGAFGYDEYAQGVANSYWSNFDLNGKSFPIQRVDYRQYENGIHEEKYRLELQTELAKTFIKKHIDGPEPFFLYLGYYGPHSPLDAPRSLTDQVLSLEALEKKGYDNNKAKYKKGTNYAKDYTEAEVRQQGLALLKGIDNGVGEIVQILKNEDQLDNTLIFFMSDNGAPLSIRSWDGSVNDPWHGAKGAIFEGGSRVPYIVHWPGVVKTQVYDKGVMTFDAAATAFAVAGGDPAKDTRLDGVDLIPFLTDKNSQAPHNYLFQRYTNTASVIHGKLKFMRHENGEELLFDVSMETPGAYNPETDLHESVNLIAAMPGKAAELREQLDAFQQSLPIPHYQGGFTKSLVDFGKTNWDLRDASPTSDNQGNSEQEIQEIQEK